MSLSATGRTRAHRTFTLTPKDFDNPIVQQRLHANKRLRLKPMRLKDEATPTQLDDFLAEKMAKIAWIIAGRGKYAVRVIVFCNKRKVAEKAKDALVKLAKAAGQTDIKDRTELFVGGRRVRERQDAAGQLNRLGFIAGSKIAIVEPAFVFATSAGEVGVDLDAEHMVCDLVESERIVQRLGRVNRRGKGDAQVVVVVEADPKPDEAAKAAMAKDPDKREEKETKIIEAHQQKIERARAKRKPFDHLVHYDDETINASPGGYSGSQDTSGQ